MKTKLFILILLGCFLNSAQAQILDKKINVTFSNTPLTEALQVVSNKAGFDYSYNAELISPELETSLTVNNEKVSNILNLLFKNTDIGYKESAGQVFLYTINKSKKILKSSNILNGHVTDTLGNNLEGVLIFDPDIMLQTETDDSGKFVLNIPTPSYTLKLLFVKENYHPKSINLKINSNQEIQVSLIHEPVTKVKITEIPVKVMEEDSRLDHTMDNVKAPSIFIPGKVVELEAPEDTLKTVFAAAGLFPPASSKGLKAGKVINNFSFHLLTDYGAGIEGFTFSGLASIYKFNVSGIAFAGLGNYIGGNMHGLQMAGLLNNNNLYTNGIQIAGIVNVSGIHMAGIQIAGITNVNRDRAYGIQIAGIGNYTHKRSIGIQIGGLFNRANLSQGVQFSALFNNTQRTQGLQMAFVNSTRRLDGLQMGFLNIADSARYGVQIGILNLVKYGYKQMEVSYDELKFFDFSFRSGAEHFYSFFKIGTAWDYAEPYYRLGFGIGSEIKIAGPLAVNIEAVGFHVTENPWTNQVSALGKIKGGLALNFWGLSLFGTYNLNGYATNYLDETQTQPQIPIIAEPIDQLLEGGYSFQWNTGYTLGLRVFL